MTEQDMQLIAVDPDVLHGHAHIRGTRIPISAVLDCLAEGLTEKEIFAQNPTLTVEGIAAAVAYGTALTSKDDPPASRP